MPRRLAGVSLMTGTQGSITIGVPVGTSDHTSSICLSISAMQPSVQSRQ